VPDIERLLLEAGMALGAWSYLLVGALTFLETAALLGFVAPGEAAVLVGGVVAGQGRISLPVLIAVVWACALLGDLTSFELGRRVGREWALRHGGRLRITEKRLADVERFLERRGNVTILVGRFLGLVRPLLPFVAGASRMPRHTYLRYDVPAAGAWAVTFSVLGFVFWRSFSLLTEYVSRGMLAVGLLVALGVAIGARSRARRRPHKWAALDRDARRR
jgi:undecaprenyl-diphosphatase